MVERAATDAVYFRDGFEAKPNDIFIALMGVTGSGKSTFISLCSDRKAEVGHDLQACTAAVEVYACQHDEGRTVYLIDTPGFDDTNRSDTEVLRELAGWLTRSYSEGIKLHGIIYLHRITDIRMQGSAKKNLLMFQKLCGRGNLKNVILATTMWDKLLTSDGETREGQLKDTHEFWGWMVSQGSRVLRHNNTKESASALIDLFVEKPAPVTLDLQQQMVNENMSLDQTAAGITLQDELAKERVKFMKELEETKAFLTEAMAARDLEAQATLKSMADDYAKRLNRLQQDHDRLKTSSENLWTERYTRLEQKLIEQQEAHEKEIELLKLASRQSNEGDVYRKENERLERRIQRQEKAHAKELETMRLASELGALNIRTSAAPELNKFTRSKPEDSRNKSGFSISMCSPFYYLGGPNQSYWNLPGGAPAQETSRNYHFRLGTSGSWIAISRKEGSRAAHMTSYNFDQVYPKLAEELGNPEWGKLTEVALGADGCYFAKYQNHWSMNTPNRTLSDLLKEHYKKVNVIAMGIQNSYVIGWEGGPIKYEFPNGLYSNLGHRLDRHKEAKQVKVLSLDQNGKDYVFVGRGESSYRSQGTNRDKFEIEEYLTKNAGVQWSHSSITLPSGERIPTWLFQKGKREQLGPDTPGSAGGGSVNGLMGATLSPTPSYKSERREDSGGETPILTPSRSTSRSA